MGARARVRRRGEPLEAVGGDQRRGTRAPRGDGWAAMARGARPGPAAPPPLSLVALAVQMHEKGYDLHTFWLTMIIRDGKLPTVVVVVTSGASKAIHG